jgi:hypothetical protein
MPTPKLPPKHTPNPDLPPPYYTELHFTIIALGSHSFTDLFAAKTTALSIVSVWQTNTGDPSLSDAKYDTLKEKLGGVVTVLNSTSAYQGLTFAHMVDRRLQGELANDKMGELDLALDGLVGAYFQFPLFRTPTDGVTHGDIMKLLYTFCKKHFDRGADTGGLGNLTWEELFYTPADPAHFSEGKLDKTLRAESGKARMQNQILPNPSERYKAFVQEDFVKALAINQCCCNYQAAHPGHYRKCAGFSGSQCSICGGTYCCLAGVQWCPNTSHVYPPPPL